MGTTITKATAASLSERPRDGPKEGADRRLVLVGGPESALQRYPSTQLQYCAMSGRSTPSLWSSSGHRLLGGERPENRPSRVARQHLAGEEDDQAQEHESHQRQADSLHDVQQQLRPSSLWRLSALAKTSVENWRLIRL